LDEAERHLPAEPIRAHSVRKKKAEPEPVRDGTLERLEEVLAEAGKPIMEDEPMAVCKGYGKNEGKCDRELGAQNETGLCTRCYVNRKYHEKKATDGTTKPKRAAKPERAAEPVAAPLVLPSAVYLAGAVESTNNGKNHVRFIMFDADVSEGNLAELTRAITNALGQR
jgi:hypothetical protein